MIRIAICTLAVAAPLRAQAADRVAPEVSGRVERAGAPVAGAEVHVVCRKYPLRRGRSALALRTLHETVKTGADGAFVARVPGYRFVSVYARSGELTSRIVDRVEAPAADLALTLDSPGKLSLRFVHRGQPARSIIPVRLVRTKAGESIAPLVVEAATDRGGSVELDGLPQATWQLFTGSAAFRLRRPTSLRCAEKPAEIELERAIALRGLVTDALRKPVAGLAFELLDPSQVFGGRTSEDGTVALAGLARGPGATLIVSGAGYRRAIVALEPGLDPRDEAPQFRLTCRKGAAARGRIVDATGKAVAGAEVLFRCDIHTTGIVSDELSVVARTDAEGRFATDELDPGAYFSVHLVEADGTPQHLTEFHPSMKSDLGTFRTGEAKVRAKVAATKGLDVAGVELRVYGPKESGRWNAFERLLPAPGGAFVGPSLVAGEYFVMAVSKKHGIGRRSVQVRRGEGAPMRFDVDVPLAAPRKVTGQVLDPGGQPIAGATVTLVPEGGDVEGGSPAWGDIVAGETLGELFPTDKYPRRVKTDAKGGFELWCYEATGRYDLLARLGNFRRTGSREAQAAARETNVLGRPSPIILRVMPR